MNSYPFEKKGYPEDAKLETYSGDDMQRDSFPKEIEINSRLIFGVLCIVCMQTPKSEADLFCQSVCHFEDENTRDSLACRLGTSNWESLFSSVGHCFYCSSFVFTSAVVFPVLGKF